MNSQSVVPHVPNGLLEQNCVGFRNV